jgi:NAD(P)-dependent dehydrogenase (short-subunit alcohol dehydrogenase family)
MPACAGSWEEDRLPADELSLQGKVAIVTGSAQRIGREIAITLAEHGARVVVSDIQDEKGEAAAATIRTAGGTATYVHADVSKNADIRALVEGSVRHFGRLDILVNNAHWEAHGTVVELSEEEWDRSFDVLLKAAFLGCKYAIPEMRKVGGGAIVNISSVHAFHVSDRYVTYEAAKAGLLHFTRQVAHDFGPDNIRCNAICPGAIPLPEWVAANQADPHFLDEYLMGTPIKRAGRPRDIANAALFLVSELASWITGTSITVDGGEFNAFPSVLRDRARQYWLAHPERLAVQRRSP